MPNELGDGEGDERLEDQSDELEELRDRIKEQHEESDGEKDDDHYSDPQDESRSGQHSERENPQTTTEESAEDVKPSTEEPEDPQELERVSTEHKTEGPESENKEDPDDELEQLRERVNEQYEEKAEDNNQDPTPNSNENDEKTPDGSEPTQEVGLTESSSEGDDLRTTDARLERPESEEEREEGEVMRPGTEKETISEEISWQSENVVIDGNGAKQQEIRSDQDAVDLGNEVGRGLTNEDASENREEMESFENLDSDSVDYLRANGNDLDAAHEEEVAGGKTLDDVDQNDQSLSEADSARGSGSGDELAGNEEGGAIHGVDVGPTETGRARSGEPAHSDALLRLADDGGEWNGNLETKGGADNPGPNVTDGHPDLPTGSAERDIMTEGGTELRRENETKADVPRNGEEEMARQASAREGPGGFGEDRRISLGNQGESADREPGRLNGENAAFNRASIDSNDEPRQGREATQESVDWNSRQTAEEVQKVLNPADGGAYQLEVTKTPMSRTDSSTSFDDSSGRRSPQMDSTLTSAAEPKSTPVRESQPERPLAKMLSEETQGKKEGLGEGQAVPRQTDETKGNVGSSEVLPKERNQGLSKENTAGHERPFVGGQQERERTSTGSEAKDDPRKLSEETISTRNHVEAKMTKEPRSEGGTKEPNPVEPRLDSPTARENSSLKRGGIVPQSEASKDTLFVAHEWKVGESNYLRIPRKYLATYGREDILEARLVRTSARDKEFHIYTSAGFVDPHLNIFHLQPSRRETFHVLSLEKYDHPDFARDFNNLRPKEFRNVKLYSSEGKMMMKVDNNVVELKHPKLFSEGGGVVFEGNLNEKKNGGMIRISRQFEQVDLHLKDYPTNHPRILYMKAVGSRIEIGHRVSQYEPDHRTRLIPSNPLDQRDRIGERIERNKLLKLDSSSMSKTEIRAWLDTEGCLYVPRPGASSSPRLDCSQKHREPLEAYVKGVEELTGVVPKIKEANKRGQLVAYVDTLEGIAEVISAVGPFRAPQRVDQVHRFMKYLTREKEGTGRRRVVERARNLLGL